LSEPAFLAELARRSGCGLLLDANNIVVTAHNLRLDPRNWLAGLPGAAITQYHLAGHAVNDADGEPILIDDHGSRVGDGVWALFAEVVKRFGVRPTLIEWDTDIRRLACCSTRRRAPTARSRRFCRREAKMPLALRDLQAAFAAHIMGGDRADLVAAVAGDTIPAAARLSVYRHHVFESLGTALAATFPTVQTLVGMDFFRGLTCAFARHSLPAQPVLTEYGADFAAFIAGYDAARDLPYLADVARLDWALNLAFHAQLGGRLKAEDLSALPVERLPSMSIALAAGAVLLSSRYPLDRIWEASQPGAASGQSILIPLPPISLFCDGRTTRRSSA